MQTLVQTESSLREVHDTITEMMKQLANEPSVGLYFVQQHVHRAVPAMVQLKAKIVDTTQEAEFVTQDVRDALNSVRTMKECGPPVIERMMKTLDSSLPRLPSFRAFRRDELPPDSTARPNLLQDPPEMPRNISKSLSDREPPFTDSAYTGYVRNIFDSAYQKASSVASVAKWTSSSRIKASTFAVERDGILEADVTCSRGDEVQSTSIAGGSPFWFPDTSTPGEYVRGLFRADGSQPSHSWGGWLPTQALRGGVNKIYGGKAREDPETKDPLPEEDDSTKVLLELEGDSYASFAAERAAELEQWLDDTEVPEIKEERQDQVAPTI